MAKPNNDGNIQPPPPPPTPPMFHPAMAVPNIKNLIPVVLDSEQVNYTTWAEFFKVTATATEVLDHIDVTIPRPSHVSTALWNSLHAIVKQWLFAMISPDLLQTVLRLKDLFHDNKTQEMCTWRLGSATYALRTFPTVLPFVKRLKWSPINSPTSVATLPIRKWCYDSLPDSIAITSRWLHSSLNRTLSLPFPRLVQCSFLRRLNTMNKIPPTPPWLLSLQLRLHPILLSSLQPPRTTLLLSRILAAATTLGAVVDTAAGANVAVVVAGVVGHNSSTNNPPGT